MLVGEYSEIKKARHILSLANLTDKIRNMYYAREEAKREKSSWEEMGKRMAEKAKKEGLEQGRVQGLEQGRAQGIEQGLEQGARSARLENAVNFLKMGLSVEQVSQGTGLSIDEVKEIQEKN